VRSVRVEAELDPQLSRWLWLVKWLLALPHLIVLAFLGIAGFFVLVIAFFAILITGRYPRGLFGFTLGVLRWTWRVSYYGYSALGTDRYPPFSLGEEPGYPARLHVEYPEHLSRGLVLVKWILAFPHYIVVAILGGATRGGLVTILTFFAGVVLLFTGRYPRELFDLILGFDRWSLRVMAYVSLLTDEYPPFRLDQGGSELSPS
jgi:hypothetical protein